MTKEIDEEKQATLIIKQAYEDRMITIHGVDYAMLKCGHKKRLKVFGYFNKISGEISGKDKNLSFLGDDEWVDNIENLMLDVIAVNDTKLSIKKNHFEEEPYSHHYITLMITAMQVVCYPFMPE